MRKYDLLTIKCRMCDWQWELTPQEKNENITCEQCGSNDIIFEKKSLHMLKSEGKFLTDIGYVLPNDKYNVVNIDDISNNYDKPLLVVKEDNVKLPEEMTNEERISILGKYKPEYSS